MKSVHLEDKSITDGSKFCNPYGFVLDSNQIMWVSCAYWGEKAAGRRGVGYFDTNNPDKGFKFVTALPTTINDGSPTTPGVSYGIAIDHLDRVWVTSTGHSILRYTKGTNDDNGTWEKLDVGNIIEGNAPYFRGIAVDRKGYGWAITTDDVSKAGDDNTYIVLIDKDTFKVIDKFQLGDSSINATWGTGVTVSLLLGNVKSDNLISLDFAELSTVFSAIHFDSSHFVIFLLVSLSV